MSQELSEFWKAAKEADREDRAENRAQAAQEFLRARKIAAHNGLTMVRHSEQHYSLSSDHWRIEVYPGNKRIYHNKNQPQKPPYLKLPPNWTLPDVVWAAIAARQEQIQREQAAAISLAKAALKKAEGAS